MTRVLGVCCALSAVVSGCHSTWKTEITNHVTRFDKKGHALNPLDGRHLRDGEHGGDESRPFAAYIRNLLENADSECDKWAQKAGTRKRRILLHVHGGLNTWDTTLTTADDVTHRMYHEDPGEWHYPIFVSWPSGALSTYGEHLLTFRQGMSWSRPAGWGTSPFVLLSDLTRGVARMPRSFTLQEASRYGVLTGTPSSRNTAALYGAASAGEDFRVNEGTYSVGLARASLREFCHVVMAPFRIATQVLAVDAMGHGAWDVMLYRTRNLVRRPEEFDWRELKRRHPEAEPTEAILRDTPSGDLAYFLEKFTKHINEQKDLGAEYEISLVGHSMGSIVINEALRPRVSAKKVALKKDTGPRMRQMTAGPESPDEDEVLTGFLPEEDIARIIYMAPACSIREAVDSIVPFLTRNRQATFHLVTLHSDAEGLEENWLGIVPSGSLLEWIDSMYTSPASLEDRRLGIWVNFFQAIHLFGSVRAAMTAKAFGVRPGSIPKKHGDFNDCPFWRPEFYGPADVTPFLPYDEEAKDWERIE